VAGLGPDSVILFVESCRTEKAAMRADQFLVLLIT